mgnify:CR=1 FL=1
MQVKTLGTINANGDNDFEIAINGYHHHPEAVVQVNITGTITIQVLGSLDGTAFVEMIAATTSDILQPIALVPFLRFTASSTSGGSAVAKVMTGAGPRY